jgi:tetratricopeptide (TPR) repeat protein
LADAHVKIGVAKTFTGRAEEAESRVLEALRLSPRDTEAYVWMLSAGLAKLYLGRDEEAAAWLRRSIEANPNYPLAHFSLACACAHLDQMSEARATAKSGLALDPTFTIHRFRAGASSDNPIYLRDASVSMRACAGPGCRRDKRETIGSSALSLITV